MKQSMKAKNKPAEPVGHPPVLDIKPELPKPSTHMPERHKHAGRKGQKGSR
ncbi:hypothetical protein [Pelomonas sp. Root1217]|uniref:hypothetical protein n=1 Tax=Pelomonas sp. Root1217 TaxID=1736430 RepID=UPI000B17711F|nr:hypothetical protein [Pelomonas sp. Root1217]